MVPVYEPSLLGNELAYLRDCINSNWISSGGDFVQRFEHDWAAYCSRRHAIAVTNGTAALQVAVDALELGPGDEVVMPSFTMISCALAVLRAGATPVLVDCDPETYTIDATEVSKAITPRTRAIMPVHMFGHPVDMDALCDLAHQYGLDIIEDAAQAHGSEYLSQRTTHTKPQKCGSFGAVSIFSFYANKVVTTGEGGMVLTDRNHLADRSRHLRDLYFGSPRYNHERMGYNYRLTNLQAAVGVAQIERIDDVLDRKRRVGELYNQLLNDVPGIKLPTKRSWAKPNYWMYTLLLTDDLRLNASAFAAHLKNKGVETRPFFIGMHEQPAFRSKRLFEGLKFPVTENLSRRGVCLPSGPYLTEAQIETVAHAVKSIAREFCGGRA